MLPLDVYVTQATDRALLVIVCDRGACLSGCGLALRHEDVGRAHLQAMARLVEFRRLASGGEAS